jgi:hypothetical protein
MKKLLLLIGIISLTSCDNVLVKKYGQTQTFTLEKNQKLVNCSWKDDQLWILTKPMKSTDSVEVYSYQEKSKYGLIEGEFIIQETK